MNPPSHHKNEVKTVREIIDTQCKYLIDNGYDFDPLEAAINAHIVNVLEELTEDRDTHNRDTGCSDEVSYIPLSAVDAAISKYKTKAQGEPEE